MAPNGKPASFVMQHQRSPLQPVHEQANLKDANIRVKNECILFSQSIMSGRWNPATNPQASEPTSTGTDGPEPRILSKKRRDLINAEIRELQNLLPLKKSARERLSYLGILALTNTFIRKATFFKKECITGDATMSCNLVSEFSSSLSGFLLVFNRDGKILYSSDNILDYLGNTVVELASQGDSIYDFVDKEDHDQVRAQLDIPPHDDNGEARKLSFFCRMATSRYMKTQMRSWKNKIVHVTGRYHRPEMSSDWSETVFFAVCTPVESKPVSDVRHHPSPRASEFKAVHGPDMKFLEVPNTVESLLGYKAEELENTSWYQWIYPEDVEQARQQHLKFVKEDGSSFACVLRMIKKDGSTVWLDITAEKSQESIGNSFICNYIVIDEEEVPYFRIHHNLLPFPEHYTDAQRQYLAYRSTLLSAALSSDASSTSTSPMTSPTGINHPDAAHFLMSHHMGADSLDTKSILRRQLIKRKLSSVDSPIGSSPYGHEVFGMPPNKMLLRSTSEMPYPTGAYHTPIQHSTSFPETTYHPHMLYRGFSTDESYLAQLHSPPTPTGYLFESGYTTLAPVRSHSLSFRPSQRSPVHPSADSVNGNNNHRNQNNNAHTGATRHEESYYPRPAHGFNPQFSSSHSNRSPVHDSAYYHNSNSPQSHLSQSPTHSPMQRPTARVANKRLSSLRHSVDGIYRDVNDIMESDSIHDVAATGENMKSLQNRVALQQQCSVNSSYANAQSPASYYQQSPVHSPVQQHTTNDACNNMPSYGQNWNQVSSSNDAMQPTNLSIHHLKQEVLGSPSNCSMNNSCNSPPQSIHPASPYNQACSSPSEGSPVHPGNSFPVSSCAQFNHEVEGYQARPSDKNYQVQYSISSGHPSSMTQYRAAAAAFYAAAQQSQRCDVLEGGQQLMKKYGHKSAMEMLLSEAEGPPYRA